MKLTKQSPPTVNTTDAPVHLKVTHDNGENVSFFLVDPR